MLVHEYKPKLFKEVVGHQYITSFFSKLIKSPANYPNSYILYGERGLGKSSLVNCVANEFKLKEENVVVKFYNINVFYKIESFAEIQQNINNMYKFTKNKYVLIFDEFHRCTSQAQQLLLNILEDETITNIYFLFTTTDISKILSTIRSRSIELYLCNLTNEEIKSALNNIIDKEKIEINEADLQFIINKSEGHLRDAYHFLNIYMLDKDNFKELIIDTTVLLEDYLLKNKDNIDKIKMYSTSILVKDLDKLIENYVYSNINNTMKIVKLLEIYSKFKNEINTISHFISVLIVLKKFFNS